MLSYLVPAAILAFSASPARAATSFLQPPAAGPFGNYRDNPIYHIDERIDVQWQSDLEFMDLILWQDYPGAGDGMSFFLKLLDNTRSTSMIWPVSFDAFSTELEDGEDAVFYFSVYQHGIDQIVSTSHYFNVTFESAEETVTSTTASRGDPTTTSGAETPAETSEEETSTSSSDPTNTADDLLDGGNGDEDGDSGLSTGAVAGISVGATLGGLAIIAGIGFFAWRHMRAKKAAQAPVEVSANTPMASHLSPHEYYKPEPPGSSSYGQYPPSHPSQPSNERSELGDNPWNGPPPHGQHRAQSVGGIHEAP